MKYSDVIQTVLNATHKDVPDTGGERDKSITKALSGTGISCAGAVHATELQPVAMRGRILAQFCMPFSLPGIRRSSVTTPACVASSRRPASLHRRNHPAAGLPNSSSCLGLLGGLGSPSGHTLSPGLTHDSVTAAVGSAGGGCHFADGPLHTRRGPGRRQRSGTRDPKKGLICPLAVSFSWGVQPCPSGANTGAMGYWKKLDSDLASEIRRCLQTEWIVVGGLHGGQLCLRRG